MLSIFSNKSSMAATKSITSSSLVLTKSMERLGTGKRINSAADDAAGLQIATRLTGQTNGMKVAQKNISDANSLLQIADGTLEEITNVVYRMKDLAVQASNDTNSEKDRMELTREYQLLGASVFKIFTGATFGGKPIFADGSDGRIPSNVDKENSYLSNSNGFNVQIGSGSNENININLGDKVGDTFSNTLIGYMSFASEYGFGRVYGDPDSTDSNNDGIPDYQQDEIALKDLMTVSKRFHAINNLEGALKAIGDIRSELGAKQNRLAHTAANLQNMQDNLSVGLSNIQDADYATEASRMTRSQMLAQTSMSMLKQSNSMSSMVQSLLN